MKKSVIVRLTQHNLVAILNHMLLTSQSSKLTQLPVLPSSGHEQTFYLNCEPEHGAHRLQRPLAVGPVGTHTSNISACC